MKIMPARIENVITKYISSVSTFPVLLAADVPQALTNTCPPDQTLTEVGCLPKDPISFISSFYGIGLGLIGGVALIFIIIGGYTIMMSRGNPNQVNVGKSYIFYAIIGLLLAVFGYFFIEVFLVDMLHLPGYGR